MSAVASPLHPAWARATAEDTLRQKTRNAVDEGIRSIAPREYAPGTKNQTVYK